MATTAENLIKEKYGNISTEVIAMKEPDNLVIGNGTGIM